MRWALFTKTMSSHNPALTEGPEYNQNQHTVSPCLASIDRQPFHPLSFMTLFIFIYAMADENENTVLANADCVQLE